MNKKTKQIKFLKKYFSSLRNLIDDNEEVISKLVLLKEKILKANSKGKKILIFGNGGSAAIASHFAIDMVNAAGVRCLNFSDVSLLTCFTNDYGYNNYITKILDKHADNNDILILISSSGESRNMLNAAKYKRKNFSCISTFTGFHKKNKLHKLGNLNFNVNSKVYNFIENTHQIWLLSLVDLIITSKKK